VSHAGIYSRHVRVPSLPAGCQAYGVLPTRLVRFDARPLTNAPSSKFPVSGKLLSRHTKLAGKRQIVLAGWEVRHRRWHPAGNEGDAHVSTVDSGMAHDGPAPDGQAAGGQPAGGPAAVAGPMASHREIMIVLPGLLLANPCSPCSSQPHRGDRAAAHRRQPRRGPRTCPGWLTDLHPGGDRHDASCTAAQATCKTAAQKLFITAIVIFLVGSALSGLSSPWPSSSRSGRCRPWRGRAHGRGDGGTW